MIEFTRLYYNVEEVVYSFKSALLKKRDVLECYFWAFELIYSGIDLFEIIWEIYYDYYSVLNPKLEKYIKTKQIQWESEHNEEPICYIIQNLFILSHSYEVYMMRNYILTGWSDILIISKPNIKMKEYLKKYDKKWHCLINAIHKGLLNNVCYHLSHLMESSDTDDNNHYDIYKVICLFIIDKLGLDQGDEVHFDKTVQRLWNGEKYSNKLHYMLAVIYQLYVDETKVNKKKIYIAPDRDDITFVKHLKTLQGDIGSKNLRDYCRFGIDKNIGCIKTLDRFKFNNYTEEIRNHWEYYARNSRYWNNILADKAVLVDSERKEIKFLNLDEEEIFYRNYGPDFDELPREIQESIGLVDIEPSERDWIYYIYGEEPELDGLICDLNRMCLD